MFPVCTSSRPWVGSAKLVSPPMMAKISGPVGKCWRWRGHGFAQHTCAAKRDIAIRADDNMGEITADNDDNTSGYAGGAEHPQDTTLRYRLSCSAKSCSSPRTP